MPQDKIVAIHQPNFFPWLGYFDKVARADVFIIMDNVQFPKKGGTWSNRVKLMVGGRADWVTMPVERAYHGTRLIRDIKINNSVPWRNLIIKTIEVNYKRAPFFDEVFSLLVDLINNPTDNLAEYNLNGIIFILKSLQIDHQKIILGSALNVEGRATDLLIAMVKAVEGNAYLSGGGTAGYQEEEKFPAAGVNLIYQNFQHPVYQQINLKQFIPGLSIIDILMNCGVEATRRIYKGIIK